jgi:hypothetical protein
VGDIDRPPETLLASGVWSWVCPLMLTAVRPRSSSFCLANSISLAVAVSGSICSNQPLTAPISQLRYPAAAKPSSACSMLYGAKTMVEPRIVAFSGIAGMRVLPYPPSGC